MNQELIDLQTRVAFQEETIQQLTDILTDQQRQIDLLRAEFALLKDSHQEVLDALERPAAADERPPHY